MDRKSQSTRQWTIDSVVVRPVAGVAKLGIDFGMLETDHRDLFAERGADRERREAVVEREAPNLVVNESDTEGRYSIILVQHAVKELEDLDGEHGSLIGIHSKQAASPKDEAGCVFSGTRGDRGIGTGRRDRNGFRIGGIVRAFVGERLSSDVTDFDVVTRHEVLPQSLAELSGQSVVISNGRQPEPARLGVKACI